jgi:hypothetical protein
MALWLKQNTAVVVKLGPFVDSGDGVTAETSLTISQGDVRLSKNGGDIAQKHDDTALAHDELGLYDCELDATDTNTLGILRVDVQESGALPVWAEFIVLPANVYDSLVAGADELLVETNTIAADAITAAAIKADAVTEIQSGLATTGAKMDLVDAPNGTAVTAIQNGLAKPGDEMDLVDAPNVASVTSIQDGLASAAALGLVATDVGAIKLKTDNLPDMPAATEDIPTAAAIATAVWQALVATHKTVAGSAADVLNGLWRVAGFGLCVRDRSLKTITIYDGAADTDAEVLVETGAETTNEASWTPVIPGGD